MSPKLARAWSAVALAAAWTWLLILAETIHSARAEPPIPEASRWVSADALIYVEWHRPDTLLDRLEDPWLQARLNAFPGYAQAFSNNAELIQARRIAELVAAQVGVTWREGLADLVRGRAVIAFDLEGFQPVLTIIVKPKDDAVLRRTLQVILQGMQDDARSKGNPDPVRQSTRDGVTIYALNDQAAYAVHQGHLLISNGVQPLSILLDRVSGRAPARFKTMADSSSLRERRAGLPDDAIIFGMVNLERLRAFNPRAFELPADQVNPLLSILFAPWVESARKGNWVAAHLVWTPEHLELGVNLATPPNGYDPVFASLVPESKQGAATPLSPPGAIASLSLRRDLAEVWKNRVTLLPPETLQGLSQLDATTGVFFGGRDFENGVLAALGSDWRIVAARPAPFAQDQPRPDVTLPSFALVGGLNPQDKDFPLRLELGFQSLVGILNLQANMNQTPPLLMSLERDGNVSMTTTRFMPPAPGAPPPDDAVVPVQYNFTPSFASLGDRFVLGSTAPLTRALVEALRDPKASEPSQPTLVGWIDLNAVADLLAANRDALVAQNMTEQGNDRETAQATIDALTGFVHDLGRFDLSVEDTPNAVRFRLGFTFQPQPGGTQP